MRVAIAVVAAAVCVHGALWALSREQTTAPNVNGQLASVSYNSNHGPKHPDKAPVPTTEQIRTDLKTFAPYTKAIRTYSSTRGGEKVAPVANEFGLRVTQGIWLDDDPLRNEREIKAARGLVRANRNINSLVVGNESVYRGETIFVGLNAAERAKLGLKPVEQLSDDEREKESLILTPAQKDLLLTDDERGRIAGAQEKDKAAQNGVTQFLNGKGPEEIRVREAINVERLIRVIQRVKRDLQIPVTTGEIFSVWNAHPNLVTAVDYIATHILPYWNGVEEANVVSATIGEFNGLRNQYPGKRVVIAEFGWPSAGYNFKDATPGRQQQAEILRSFVARAEQMGIDYNIVEAIDQQWKVTEGSVGPYWGMFDGNLKAKFAWSGPILDPEHWRLAGIAILVGVLLSLPILAMASVTVGQAALLSLAAHAVGGWVATVFAYWNGHYFVPGAVFALVTGMILMIPLVLIAMARIEEIAAVAFGRKGRRTVGGPALANANPNYTPKVSIHIPAYREQPEMLKQTLDSLAAMTYPNWEAVVIINNTPDPAFVTPIEEHCKLLGDRFKFINAEKVEGFKAGALRIALAATAPDAEIIGVIDADYAVTPDWLTDLAPTFADARVGIVQAPQDHRDGNRSLMHHAMGGEYSGFFDIGMVERNEVNAIVIHGTMCLIRRSALDAAGSWPDDTICEDTDLGLTILEQGWIAHYTNKRYGYGLLPDTFEAFKKQRHRWAYGGLHIVRKHWRRFLPGRSQLTRDQRREYIFGWISWMGAEALGVLVAIFNLIWVPIVAFVGIAVPDKVLTLPIVAAFTVTMLHFIMLYRLRVDIPKRQAIASAFAAMSLQFTVAKAMFDGIVKDGLPFNVTAKGGAKKKAAKFQAFWESIIGGLLIAGSITLIVTNYQQITEIYIFAFVLVVQSLPFLSAVAMALLENSKFNEFAYWTNLRARMAARLAPISARLPRLGNRTQVPAPLPVSAKQPETVQ
ncbi:poly-beta-1,6-N-acetyl-D-glucosamine synthase [Variibacter gotjawalensis]|uniref:Beta-monoglucosyldiacylglycerol synthase n=1 Tax=Variibacter gotjawalensis TaxID=1333996 RepID=A0A0S3PXI8_9BRAD|nr:glycosyltransferase [Variibacter gotjawalensis]NIK46482.1 exo-beta-1,3-glucanase (GH17 family)/cellulose synthase/poly-beta-1,6-N-acetylglucosamine synthase-like glycosyltransferase [Variibacter gotjawalensis]RZS48390.1 cellulose synthase/poly-beta-1,6-N-acetylglucosamine synthase-like glycosyltransferase [Variibacter gotjawalensis]BAT60649.1 poly-beta-1,6-N-acetyl-D-glucosamine synthase [Variibacter gotjawalensis]